MMEPRYGSDKKAFKTREANVGRGRYIDTAKYDLENWSVTNMENKGECERCMMGHNTSSATDSCENEIVRQDENVNKQMAKYERRIKELEE